MGDLLIVLVVALVLVLVWRGPKTLPRLGEALGRGVREAREQATAKSEGDDATSPNPPSDGDRRS